VQAQVHMPNSPAPYHSRITKKVPLISMASKKKEKKKEQLTESINLRSLSDQATVQDEEVILSH
jgi:hypothetical protein